MPVMDWDRMLLDGTYDVGDTATAFDGIFVGAMPFQNLQLEIYIPGTVLTGTTTLLIQECSDAAGTGAVTVATFDVPDQAAAATYYLTVPPNITPTKRYLRANFSAIQAGSDLGYVQIGFTLGEKQRLS